MQFTRLPATMVRVGDVIRDAFSGDEEFVVEEIHGMEGQNALAFLGEALDGSGSRRLPVFTTEWVQVGVVPLGS